MPSLQGNPRSFHKKFKFIVDIDEFDNAGFQKSSELSAEIAKIEYFEGGALIPNKSPGRLTFTDVTFERGATKDLAMFSWFKEVANASAGSSTDVSSTGAGTGLIDEEYKRDIDIVQQDRDGTELRRWSLAKAYPIKFVAGEWDNDADEVTINMMTVTYDFFDSLV